MKWIPIPKYSDGEWDFDELLARTFFSLLVLMLALVLAFGASAIVLSANSDGKADYCYISEFPTELGLSWRLSAHRSWRSNTGMGTFPTFQQAVDAAHAAGCPLR